MTASDQLANATGSYLRAFGLAFHVRHLKFGGNKWG